MENPGGRCGTGSHGQFSMEGGVGFSETGAGTMERGGRKEREEAMCSEINRSPATLQLPNRKPPGNGV